MLSGNTLDGGLVVGSARLRWVIEVSKIDLFIYIPDSCTPQATVLYMHGSVSCFPSKDDMAVHTSMRRDTGHERVLKTD
jgi:hypothetical protein